MLHDGGERDGGRIGAAAAQGRDVAVRVAALEAGDDDDVAVVERIAQAFRRDAFDACLRMARIGDDADLGAGETDRFFADALNRHGH